MLLRWKVLCFLFDSVFQNRSRLQKNSSTYLCYCLRVYGSLCELHIKRATSCFGLLFCGNIWNASHIRDTPTARGIPSHANAHHIHNITFMFPSSCTPQTQRKNFSKDKNSTVKVFFFLVKMQYSSRSASHCDLSTL